ncbi:MAG: transposase [Myxococcales bacterium]|jgi:hypothetical protein|nr:transposase [Myxococcales bacterium]
MRFLFLKEDFEWIGILKSMSAMRVSISMFSSLATISCLRTILRKSKHSSEWMKFFEAQEAVERVVLEATGRLEREAFNAFNAFNTLLEARLPVAGVNPKIEVNDSWLARAKRLDSIPGIGKTLSMTLVAPLAEIGQLDNRQIAALVGLVPFNRESGSMRRFSHHGVRPAPARKGKIPHGRRDAEGCGGMMGATQSPHEPAPTLSSAQPSGKSARLFSPLPPLPLPLPLFPFPQRPGVDFPRSNQ